MLLILFSLLAVIPFILSKLSLTYTTTSTLYPASISLPYPMSGSDSITILFGSCHSVIQMRKSELILENRIWKAIYEQSAGADMFLWLGDIFYPDIMHTIFDLEMGSWDIRGFLKGETPFLQNSFVRRIGQYHTDGSYEDAGRELLRLTAEMPWYKAMVNSGIRINGIYDDHDMAGDFSDGTWPYKNVSQKLLFDFLKVPQDHPRRRQKDGIYTREDIIVNNMLVVVLLLDMRTENYLAKGGSYLAESQ